VILLVEPAAEAAPPLIIGVKTEDLAVAAGHSVDPARWQEAFEVLMGRIAAGSRGWSPGGG